MKRFIFAIPFLLVISGHLLGQSGRRVAPTPTPAATQDDSSQYSESKPKAPRTTRLAERFPNIGIGGNAKNGQSTEITVTNPDVKEDGEVLKIETNLITIPVSVFDRNGLYIPGLRQTEFKIFEDGVEQEIAYFGTTDKPFTVILLLDTSLSTEYKIEEIRRAAIAFVDNLEPRDRVMVIHFQRQIHVSTAPTSDRQKIYKAIEKANFDNGTSLYDAVDFSLRKWMRKIDGRKAIVLFTDGVDTTSSKTNYDSTVHEAEESDTLIFPIYYNTFSEQAQIGGLPLPGSGGILGALGTSASEYALGRKYLDDLADATGGRVFRPESTPGGLTRAFEGIAEELRRQYNIGYVPTSEGKPGQRKQIKVRVDRPNLILRSRDSYIVGTTVAPPPAEPVKPQK